ncbi:Protein SPIRAL1-like 2 [Bienertia sinuspersici]
MGHGVSNGGGQISLGYVFGNGEAPKPAANKVQANISTEHVVKEAAKPAATNPQPGDIKKVPAGVNSYENNYHHAYCQNTGNFIMV